MKTIVIESVPQWAVNYIVNGDISDLEQEDIEIVNQYLQGLADEGFRLTSPIEGSENEFCAYPEFGKACATVDFQAVDSGLYDKE